MHRPQKARGTFQRLSRVWAARAIGRRTKIRLFNTLVRPVLLYGCETWKITKNDERNLNSFPCKSLRRIRIRIRILRREGENVCLKYQDGLLKVGGQEEDQKLLGEGQSSKSETKLGGRAGKQPNRLHKTESVGQPAWRTYAPTGAKRLDNDDKPG